MQIYDLIAKRLAGDWERSGVLAIDPDGNRHLIEDDGKSLKMEDIRIECREPLPALARILSDKKLIILDRQNLNRKVMLTATEALQYIRESGLQVAAIDGTLYRFQNGTIFKGKDTINILPEEGEYLPESVMLLFSSLDTQPIYGECTTKG